MDLIKENKEKRRSMYQLPDRYRKVWHINPDLGPFMETLDEHLEILERVMPDYVIDYGSTTESIYIDFKIIPGVPANTFPHTKEFAEKIFNFCIENINQTSPYAHGDWVLSNILIDGDKMHIIDWDNVGIYDIKDVMEKLKSDLKSAFGENFNKFLPEEIW